VWAASLTSKTVSGSQADNKGKGALKAG